MTEGTLVITGGSRGIGREVASGFIERGWQVFNLSRTPIELARAEQVDVDLASTASIAKATAQIAGELAQGRVALVHNAGLLRKDSVENLTPESLAEVMHVNVTAPIALNQALLEHMQAGSSITYVGSTLSEKAVAGAASYVISKHALVGLMRATCQDLAGRDIHTSCVCPGFTDTEMLRAHVGHDDGILDAIASQVTFRRLIEPKEIARLITFAATNPVVNGSVLHANLGQIER